MIFLSWKCKRREKKSSLKTSYKHTKINNVLKCNLPYSRSLLRANKIFVFRDQNPTNPLMKTFIAQRMSSTEDEIRKKWKERGLENCFPHISE